jgi:hypothetical protein
VTVIRPVPDELSAPFWDGARRHRLVLRRCCDCGRYQHPPRVLCPWCAGSRHEYREVPGDGQVCSYTATPDGDTVVVVELDLQAGLLLVGSVPGPRPEWVGIGTRVRMWFEHVPGDEELVLPQFAPAGT